MSKDIVVNPENIKFWRDEYSTKTDEELIAISEGCHQMYVTGVTAKIILSERRTKFVNDKHSELLAEIKKPHKPSFYLLVASVIFAAASFVVAFVQQSPAQSPAVVVAPSTQTTQSASNTPASSPPALPHSVTSQPSTTKK